MAKKKRRRPPAAAPAESPVSMAVTVAWMLSVMTTLVLAIVAALIWLVAKDRADNQTALTFARLLHFSAIVTAFISLAMLPVVLKVRREPPPLSVAVFAVIVAALPIVAAFLD